MRAVLVLGGDPPTEGELAELAGADLVVASDSGAAVLLTRGIRPDRIVGDLDSLAPALLEQAVRDDVPLERHPRAKAETDGELALRWILDQGVDRLVLVGGHGGRSAMFLTHLPLLRRASEAGVEAVMKGHGEALRVLHAGGRHTIARGVMLNLIALESAVVVLEGLHFSGTVELPPWTGKGVSNRALSEASVTVRQGVVLVVEERDQVAAAAAVD